MIWQVKSIGPEVKTTAPGEPSGLRLPGGQDDRPFLCQRRISRSWVRRIQRGTHSCSSAWDRVVATKRRDLQTLAALGISVWPEACRPGMARRASRAHAAMLSACSESVHHPAAEFAVRRGPCRIKRWNGISTDQHRIAIAIESISMFGPLRRRQHESDRYRQMR